MRTWMWNRSRAARLLSAAAAVLMVAGLCAPQAAAAPDTARQHVLGVPLAPGTAGLTPQLGIAYTLAHRAAQAAGVPMYVNSGKRSRAEQARLWRDGIGTYGSPEAARRWVLPPGESTHVTGEAIDVGPRAGAAWLQRNGIRWGLCRTFDNEWWHFELVAVPGTQCPRRLPDASHR
ncbi:M15 family metallopeptidase [Gordonia hydrophobica]|uniref:M15 family metallopeptidase n=1 Tax=Gordonia hydrophobica TaxID=40516 RepID=A0ABZ2U7M7_9ACTN|nr:M15 family metallopeptidase [Gordonia hydrophobica]